MIDHLIGRPSPSWKRTQVSAPLLQSASTHASQVFLVIFFWLWRIVYGNPGGPRLLWIRRANKFLSAYPYNSIPRTPTHPHRRAFHPMAAYCQHTH